MAVEVRDNPEEHRYEILVEGRLTGIADYRVSGTTMLMPHTEIAPAMRGRGLGATLVRWALDDARRSGRTVVAGCWYVARFIADHPEYGDLLAP
jgi:predicted GNAT family acetyltransferase